MAMTQRYSLADLNPTSRILALLLISVPLTLSIDWVSAVLSLLGIFFLFLLWSETPSQPPFSGGLSRSQQWAQWGKMSIPLLGIAPLSGLSMLLYAQPRGRVYVEWGLITVSDHSIQLAIAITVRVVAIGLSSIIFLSTIDPQGLGDALVQRWHFPERFVLGAVAGLRMLTLLREDWYAVERARRARGVEKDHIQQTIALFIMAVRRGSKLGTAMEARGFRQTLDSTSRTWMRTSTVGRKDYFLVLQAGLISCIAVGASVISGHFLFLGVG